MSVLKELLKVKLNKNQETDLREYKASEVKLIRNVESNAADDELDMEALKRLEEEEIKYIR